MEILASKGVRTPSVKGLKRNNFLQIHLLSGFIICRVSAAGVLRRRWNELNLQKAYADNGYFHQRHYE
ncbi:hypothetical protein V6N12_043150 [Hibiscus sabdariffa]|uniref:Hexosyltransferase n=1 Tax=Hibiscus sabdariffa TaxID=183260 RepID=A0ABR2DID5_9ROSI